MTGHLSDLKIILNYTNVELHNILRIGSYAFVNCGIEKLSIPNIIELKPSTFYKSKLKSIKLPLTLRRIGKNCFRDCELLEEVDMMSCSELHNGCFEGCYALRTIRLPNNLHVMEHSCFKECSSLQHITIPAYVVRIPTSCFEDCDDLRMVYFEKPKTAYPLRFESRAFRNCKDLEYIQFSKRLTIGPECFEKCINLTISSSEYHNIQNIKSSSFKDTKYETKTNNLRVFYELCLRHDPPKTFCFGYI